MKKLPIWGINIISNELAAEKRADTTGKDNRGGVISERTRGLAARRMNVISGKEGRVEGNLSVSFLLAHFLLIILIVTIFLPSEKKTESIVPFLGTLVLIECCYLLKLRRRDWRIGTSADLLVLIWGFLLVWEICTTKMNLMQPVLFPSPENVFYVFKAQYKVLLSGVFSSMQLLVTGFTLGISLGVVLGLLAGWVPRLRDLFFPAAQVLVPISPIIYAPYLIALMPTFRSASALIIFLGIFGPTFLNMVIRVNSIDKKIIDSARAMNVRGFTMVSQILLPYVLPSVVSGLKVTLTTSIMMLTFAEMMGATSGMGYYIINYTHYANYTNVLAGIILVGIVITVLNRLVGFIQEKAIRWK